MQSIAEALSLSSIIASVVKAKRWKGMEIGYWVSIEAFRSIQSHAVVAFGRLPLVIRLRRSSYGTPMPGDAGSERRPPHPVQNTSQSAKGKLITFDRQRPKLRTTLQP